MKLLYLSLLAFLSFGALSTTDVDTVAQLIGKGSAHELAKMFAPEVEIGLPGVEEDAHPKAAAEAMLDKFFIQNKPTGSKVLHKINNGSSIQYAVITLLTNKGPYRVSFSLKNEKGTTQLIKILIETDKVK